MSKTYYTDSVARDVEQKLGDFPDLIDFTGDPSGGSSSSAALQRAVNYISSKGAGAVHIRGGNYVITEQVTFPDNVTVYGDGERSRFYRGTDSDLPAGHAMFSIAGNKVALFDFYIDGQTTTPTNKLYGSMTGENGSDDPMHSSLTLNTSIWVRPGVTDFVAQGVTFNHTGGYAILLDARDGDITGVRIVLCKFLNGRPHLFGIEGDLGYGSWTGGIHYQGDCRDPKLYAVHDLEVADCTFRRNTGNCFWGHLYGFDTLHQNIKAHGNHFEDCGLDGILVGGVSGGFISNNTFRRIGYVCTDDSSPGTPKALTGRYAVGLDTSGVVRGVTYSGNTFMSVNGGCIDLDGFGEGTVTGNTCVIPSEGQPEYTEDQIALHWGGTANWTYGCQPSNTANHAIPGSKVTITGNTFINMGGGAIRMFAARNCLVQGNNIYHPSTAVFPPLALGNVGTGPYQRTNNTTVTGNTFYYDPPSPQACIFEDNTYGAFDPADRNWVQGNRVFGGAFEFKKDSVTASITALRLPTQATVAAGEQVVLQTEGTGALASLKAYKDVANVATQMMQLQFVNNGLNVSSAGTAGTGILLTGNHTSAAWGDSVVTGKLFGDSMLAMASYNHTDADANLLDNNYGIIRWNNTDKRFEVSISTSAGARVWGILGPAGVNTSVQYNDNGYFGGDTYFHWNKTTKLLTVTGVDGTAGIAVGNGYIQSDQGFLVTPSTGNFFNTFQATAGGLMAKNATLTGYISLRGINADPAANTGDSFDATYATNSQIYFNQSAARVYIKSKGVVIDPGVAGAASLIVNGGYVQSDQGYYTAAVSDEAIKVTGTSVGGGGGIAIRRLNIYRAAGGATGYDLVIDENRNAAFLGVNAGTVASAGSGTFSAEVGFYSPKNANAVINCPNGGTQLRSMAAFAYIWVGNSNGVPTATPGDNVLTNGIIYYDTGAQKFKFRQNGAWAELSGAGDSLTTENTWTRLQNMRVSSSYDAIWTMGSAGSNKSAGMTMLDHVNSTSGYLTYFGTTSSFLPNTVVLATSGIDLHLRTGSSNKLTIRGSDGHVTIAGINNNESLRITAGYIYSDDGYYSPSTAYNAFQAPSGGALFSTLVCTYSGLAAIDASNGGIIGGHLTAVSSSANLGLRKITSLSVSNTDYGNLYFYSSGASRSLRFKYHDGSNWQDKEVNLL